MCTNLSSFSSEVSFIFLPTDPSFHLQQRSGGICEFPGGYLCFLLICFLYHVLNPPKKKDTKQKHQLPCDFENSEVLKRSSFRIGRYMIPRSLARSPNNQLSQGSKLSKPTKRRYIVTNSSPPQKKKTPIFFRNFLHPGVVEK